MFKIHVYPFAFGPVEHNNVRMYNHVAFSMQARSFAHPYTDINEHLNAIIDLLFKYNELDRNYFAICIL